MSFSSTLSPTQCIIMLKTILRTWLKFIFPQNKDLWQLLCKGESLHIKKEKIQKGGLLICNRIIVKIWGSLGIFRPRLATTKKKRWLKVTHLITYWWLQVVFGSLIDQINLKSLFRQTTVQSAHRTTITCRRGWGIKTRFLRWC